MNLSSLTSLQRESCLRLCLCPMERFLYTAYIARSCIRQRTCADKCQFLLGLAPWFRKDGILRPLVCAPDGSKGARNSPTSGPRTVGSAHALKLVAECLIQDHPAKDMKGPSVIALFSDVFYLHLFKEPLTSIGMNMVSSKRRCRAATETG